MFIPLSISDDFHDLQHGHESPHWSLQGGYTSTDAEIYPKRVLGAGSRAGLVVIVSTNVLDYDYTCRGPVQGFKVLLHTPGEMPRVSKHYFRIPMQQEVLISVKPNMMTTSDGLKDYSPFRRQCYLNDELKLKYFKVYTQANCELECLANADVSSFLCHGITQ
jgi:acid-sensing ion channel, other